MAGTTHAIYYSMTYLTLLTYTLMDDGRISVSWCELTKARQIPKKGTFHMIGYFPTWAEALAISARDTCKVRINYRKELTNG
jgi:hypothetical protein